MAEGRVESTGYVFPRGLFFSCHERPFVLGWTHENRVLRYRQY